MNIKSNSKSIFYLFIFLFNLFFVAPSPKKNSQSSQSNRRNGEKNTKKKLKLLKMIQSFNGD